MRAQHGRLSRAEKGGIGLFLVRGDNVMQERAKVACGKRIYCSLLEAIGKEVI